MHTLINYPSDSNRIIKLVSPANDLNGSAAALNASLEGLANAMVMAITSNTTLYVATTGSDSNPGTASEPFATVSGAMAYLARFIIDAGVTVTVSVAAGVYSDDPVFNHPSGGNIVIAGVEFSFTASNIACDGVSNAVLTFASVANLAVNDYLFIRPNTTDQIAQYVAGCWQVTNISGTSVTINTTGTDGYGNYPNGAYSLLGVILKTQLGNVTVSTGAALGGLNNIYAPTITLQSGAFLKFTGYIGVNSVAVGGSLVLDEGATLVGSFLAAYSAELIAVVVNDFATLALSELITNGSDVGVQTDGLLSANTFCASRCGFYGLSASFGTAISPNLYVSGCGTGVLVQNGGTVIALGGINGLNNGGDTVPIPDDPSGETLIITGAGWQSLEIGSSITSDSSAILLGGAVTGGSPGDGSAKFANGNCSIDGAGTVTAANLPAPPVTAGTYHLTCMVSGGVPAYSWS